VEVRSLIEVRTDQAGRFKISQLKPGNYCLDITGPQLENDDESGSRNIYEAGQEYAMASHGWSLVEVLEGAEWPQREGKRRCPPHQINEITNKVEY
jgi:hypothetical protein